MNFEQLFGQAQHMAQGFQEFLGVPAAQQQHFGQAAQQAPAATPPASRRYIASLRETPVVSDDLIEENNKECLVCLEEQRIGGLAVKLPCGHLYHKKCVVDWLQRHCTCPCCRFEVESNDSHYEEERRKRMRERKLRMRADEIAQKSVLQLKDLCHSLNISILGCIDKSEIVDRLKTSGRIEITEGMPAPTVYRSDLNVKSVVELKHMLKSYGLSDEGALEKRELRARLEESGRIIIAEGEAPAEGKAAEDGMVVDERTQGGSSTCCSEGGSSSSSSSSGGDSGGCGDVGGVGNRDFKLASTTSGSSSSCSAGNSHGKFELSRSFLLTLPIRELKSILSGYAINTTKCVERKDLIDLISGDSRFAIVED